MSLTAIGSSSRNGRLGLDLLYGSETQQSLIVLTCSGSFTNFAPSGAIVLCSLNFTLSKPTTIQIIATGGLTQTGAGGANFHQLWIQVDAIGAPTFSVNYVPASAPANAFLSASQALGAGAHSVQLKYFAQTTGLGSDSGSQQMTVSYTP